jgi:short-subunit dehydrogenase
VTAARSLPWNSAWIVGASTGIGKDLALKLATSGVTTAISARTEKTLADTAALNERLHAFAADVSDRASVQKAYDAIMARQGAPDLVVLNAAIWDPMSVEDYGAARAINSMNVNYGGVCNALEVILPVMKQKRSGHVAIVASVAGYRGLSRALAYAPTKAALINLAEALNLELGPWNVKVSVINPGFVDTPMTARNDFAMPFIVSSEVAARKIVEGLVRGRFEIAFPWQLVTILKIARILPYRLFFPIMRKALNL